MKRIWFALASVAVIITACILELLWIENSTSTLKQNIDEILEVLENEDTANEQDKKDTAHLGEELHSNWDSLHTVLAVFIDHSRLEDIDQSIAVIAECLKKDEESDFYVESAKLKAQLEHLKDTELPTISNIL